LSGEGKLGVTRGGEFARGTLDQQSLRIRGPDDATLYEGWPVPEVLLADRRVCEKPWIIVNR